MKPLSTRELAEWLVDADRAKPLLLDVREPWENNVCQIDGSLLAPMQTVPQRMNEWDAARDIVCICHHGGRSMHVAMFLERHGFASVFNLTGGVDAWARQVDPTMPTY
jgi:rhodanese-related sulfurtransferase